MRAVPAVTAKRPLDYPGRWAGLHISGNSLHAISSAVTLQILISLGSLMSCPSASCICAMQLSQIYCLRARCVLQLTVGI